MLLLLISACLLPPEAIEARIDADGDGYDAVAFGGLDCDDDDPEINPGAEEACEDVDRNCDGELGTADADGDGFAGCEECNDLDAAIHPGAQEVCDDAEVDEDCDGLVNDDDDSVDLSTGTAFYVDGDGDGEGNVAAGTVQACALQPGLATDNGDCNDSDPFIPMPHEWCRNGLDDNCAGSGPEKECGVPIPVTDLRASMTGTAGAQLGRGLVFLPDVDGDGLDDYAVGAPGVDDQRGVVYVFTGPPKGELDLNAAFATLRGAQAGDFTGFRLATGDPDLDGEPELLVGMGGATLPGGTGAWFVSELDLAAGEQRQLNYGLPHVRGHLEENVPFLGGLNAVVTTPDEVVVGFIPAYGQQGRVAGYAHAIAGEESIDSADWMVRASGGIYPAAGTLQYADLDGDGAEDIVGTSKKGSTAGVLWGPFTGVSDASFDVELTLENETAVGRPSAVGDFDGDGELELALTSLDLSAPGVNTLDRLRVYDDLSSSPVSRWKFAGLPDDSTGLDRQGLAMADIDGDGADDLLWGMSAGGQLWQIYSGLDGGVYTPNNLRTLPSHGMGEILGPGGDSTSFGTDIAVGGDINGDGRPDVLLGDHGNDEGGPAAGQAWLMLGGRW